MCSDCEARRQLVREAFLKAQFAKALGHAATGAAEAVGIKEKSGAKDLAESKSKAAKQDPGAAG